MSLLSCPLLPAAARRLPHARAGGTGRWSLAAALRRRLPEAARRMKASSERAAEQAAQHRAGTGAKGHLEAGAAGSFRVCCPVKDLQAPAASCSLAPHHHRTHTHTAGAAGGATRSASRLGRAACSSWWLGGMFCTQNMAAVRLPIATSSFLWTGARVRGGHMVWSSRQ